MQYIFTQLTIPTHSFQKPYSNILHKHKNLPIAVVILKIKLLYASNKSSKMLLRVRHTHSLWVYLLNN